MAPVSEIAWPTILLVCGIVTYVSLLQNPALDPAGERDVITYFGDWAAGLGAAVIAALLVLYVAAIAGLVHLGPPLGVFLVVVGSIYAGVATEADLPTGEPVSPDALAGQRLIVGQHGTGMRRVADGILGTVATLAWSWHRNRS